MDIKIRARLSAYSKIASVDGVSTSLPMVGVEDAGAVLGVSETGNYTIFPTVKNEKVDELFLGMDTERTVEKSEIDTLFQDAPTVETVTKQEIDKLFGEQEEVDSVDKEDIDTLFNSESTIGTVSFADIDSLFK